MSQEPKVLVGLIAILYVVGFSFNTLLFDNNSGVVSFVSLFLAALIVFGVFIIQKGLLSKQDIIKVSFWITLIVFMRLVQTSQSLIAIRGLNLFGSPVSIFELGVALLLSMIITIPILFLFISTSFWGIVVVLDKIMMTTQTGKNKKL